VWRHSDPGTGVSAVARCRKTRKRTRGPAARDPPPSLQSPRRRNRTSRGVDLLWGVGPQDLNKRQGEPRSAGPEGIVEDAALRLLLLGCSGFFHRIEGGLAV